MQNSEKVVKNHEKWHFFCTFLMVLGLRTGKPGFFMKKDLFLIKTTIGVGKSVPLKKFCVSRSGIFQGMTGKTA